MKLKKIIIMSILLLFSILTFGNINSYAASGSFSVSKSSISLEKGKSTTFTINLKNCEGVFAISSSNTSVATVSTSRTGWLESKATITIKAKAKGTATISVKAEDVADSSAKEVTGTKSIKVTVTDSSSNTSNKPSTTNNSNNNNNTSNSSNNNNDNNENKKSNIATLKNLGITPNDFSGFRKMTLNYSVKVPNSVSKVKIYADPTDSKATVTGTGSKNLKVGKNTFAIKVTAEDKKTTKTYVLNITREEKQEEKEPEENTVENKVDETPVETKKDGLSNLEISGFTLNPAFSQDNYEYNVDVPSDKKTLDIKTEKTGDDITVEVVGNENLKLGENVITLLVYNSKKENIATYQIFANLKEEQVDLTEVNSFFKNANQKALMKKIIIIAIIIVIIVLIIVFATKKNKMIEKEFEYDKEEDRLPKMLQEEKEEKVEKTVKKRNRSKGNHFK